MAWSRTEWMEGREGSRMCWVRNSSTCLVRETDPDGMVGAVRVRDAGENVPDYEIKVSVSLLPARGTALALGERLVKATEPGSRVVSPRAVEALREAVERASAGELAAWAWEHVLRKEE